MNTSMWWVAVVVSIFFGVSVTNAEAPLYINIAPDIRYSSNGVDSRITLVVEKALYAYGNEFGEIVGCGNEEPDCWSIWF